MYQPVALSSVKYLGATLDQCLSCESMAGFTIKKTYSRLQFLYRTHNYLTQHIKRLFVMALIQCHFDYACSFWYHGLLQVWKNKLQTSQNKIMLSKYSERPFRRVSVIQRLTAYDGNRGRLPCKRSIILQSTRLW